MIFQIGLFQRRRRFIHRVCLVCRFDRCFCFGKLSFKFLLRRCDFVKNPIVKLLSSLFEPGVNHVIMPKFAIWTFLGPSPFVIFETASAITFPFSVVNGRITPLKRLQLLSLSFLSDFWNNLMQKVIKFVLRYFPCRGLGH